MKTKQCQRCSKSFPLHLEVNGKMLNLYTRTFCLDCSPIGGLKEINGKKICSGCRENKDSNDFNRYTNGKLKSWCKACVSKSAIRRQQQTKMKAVQYKGGACQQCGYNKCVAALQFHHLDPSKKEFRIGQGCQMSWFKLKVELDKCELLCANCHAEIHGQSSLSQSQVSHKP